MKNSTQFVLGLGGARSGSSWLYKQLYDHPEFISPPVKEIHYWSRNPNYPSPSYLSCQSWTQRLFGSCEPGVQWRKQVWRVVRKLRHEKSIGNFAWRLKWLTVSSDSDYLRLLAENRKIGFDITPGYVHLSRDELACIKGLLGGLKAVYIGRDPVSRTWSEIRYRFPDLSQDELSNPAFLGRIINKGMKRRSDVASVVEKAGSAFGDCFLYMPFSLLVEQPEQFWRKICEFLEVDASAVDVNTGKVNSAKRCPIPVSAKNYLLKEYDEIYSKIDFGGIVV